MTSDQPPLPKLVTPGVDNSDCEFHAVEYVVTETNRKAKDSAVPTGPIASAGLAKHWDDPRAWRVGKTAVFR